MCPPSTSSQTVFQLANSLVDGRTKLKLARLWLVVRLLDGPEEATVMLSEGEAKGFGKKLLRRAGDGLVRHTKSKRFKGGWLWDLHPRLDTSGVSEYREAIVKRLLELSE